MLHTRRAPSVTAGRPGRNRRSLIAVACLLAATVLASAGCTTTIVPPRSPADPVDVFLLDHGDTASIVLPTPEGNLTRYVYGDWNWYALGNTGLLDGVHALFWSSQATLGRRDWAGPPTAEVVRQRIHAHAIEALIPITVGRNNVERLRSRLDAAHRTGAQRAKAERLDIEFVPHDDPYTYFHNSNHRVALWLRELGTEVRGPAFHSRWRVESATRAR